MTQETITLGPFRQGEVPEPFTYRFMTAAGVGINLGGYTAELDYRRWMADALDVVTRSATVEDGQDVEATAGRVTYVWVEADLAAAGDFEGELWVDKTNRLASIALRWHVEPSIRDWTP